ncbi:hypothetical protein L227DRAFT_653865 [Lentinus tigrinus ALCF2SS1-6]|uniref:Uncharacterized protein n=1 Tax=Lentinus tigrinus ALCF2SS1-6 TaxID=1328759 RepID=A0A5C2SE26_9APHY|nr:hypothetical protein L227DRAFT_653865 [Lentinus tigrinus ALCF2SS1-6]
MISPYISWFPSKAHWIAPRITASQIVHLVTDNSPSTVPHMSSASSTDSRPADAGSGTEDALLTSSPLAFGVFMQRTGPVLSGSTSSSGSDRTARPPPHKRGASSHSHSKPRSENGSVASSERSSEHSCLHAQVVPQPLLTAPSPSPPLPVNQTSSRSQSVKPPNGFGAANMIDDGPALAGKMGVSEESVKPEPEGDSASDIRVVLLTMQLQHQQELAQKDAKLAQKDAMLAQTEIGKLKEELARVRELMDEKLASAIALKESEVVRMAALKDSEVARLTDANAYLKMLKESEVTHLTALLETAERDRERDRAMITSLTTQLEEDRRRKRRWFGFFRRSRVVPK